MKLDMTDQEFIRLDREAIELLIDRHGRQLTRKGTDQPKRRRIQRWPFPGTVQLWFEDLSGEENQIIGTCHNLNENGIGLYCERSFEVGREIPIAIHQPEATYHGNGVVRHCTQSGPEYFIGLEFVEAGEA